MNNIYKKVLIISSADPMKGPGAIGRYIYEAFLEKGYSSDFLTLYRVQEKKEFKFIYKYPSKLNNIRFKFQKKFINPINSGYCFFYKKETMPPVSVNKVLNAIGDDYDLVIIFFWQNLLSFKTIEKLYDKLKCKFIFYFADYSPMSGGCHFTMTCENFRTGCGCCPAINSRNPNDFTHWNVLYRKRVYEKVKPILLGNTYMIDNFFNKSYLLKEQQKAIVSVILNLDLFRPINQPKALAHFNLKEEDRFIIGFGCQSLTDSRKGMSYLFKALDFLFLNITEEERKKILLLSIGNNESDIVNHLKFDYKCLGYINENSLPLFYSSSNIFVSPSIYDAGPSMVNQSIACGTPVISFEMGCAIDVIKGQKTGYCAKLYNFEDMANGILQFLRMPDKEYKEIKRNCRELAMQVNSKEGFLNLIECL